MPTINNDKLAKFRFRASLPRAFRILTLCLLAIAGFAVLVGFYRGRATNGFKLKSEHTQLSTEVVSNVNGYERLESADGRKKYLIRADNAITYSDQHQELSNMSLETYDESGAVNSTMTAGTALYIPEAVSIFTLYLKDAVAISTNDGISIKGDNVRYDRSKNTAESEDPVEFSRGELTGKANGFAADLGTRQLDFFRDVDITMTDADGSGRVMHVKAASATFINADKRIDLNGGIVLTDRSSGSTTEAKAVRASVYLSKSPLGDSPAGDTQQVRPDHFELFDNVSIVSTRNGSVPMTVNAGYASYNKPTDTLELKTDAVINNGAGSVIKADLVHYEQGRGRVHLENRAELTQNGDISRADAVDAVLFPDRSLNTLTMSGNASVSRTTAERTVSVSAPVINAVWNTMHQMQSAKAVGSASARIVPTAKGAAAVTVNAAKAIEVAFAGADALNRIDADGRTSIKMDGDGPATRTVTADRMNTIFYADGKSIRRAEAIGNAVLSIEPLQGGPNVYRTDITSPRFDCDFFASGNSIKLCAGVKPSKAVRRPMFQQAGRGEQTLTSDRMRAVFRDDDRRLDRLEAEGKAKFNELDRNAAAAAMTYSDDTGAIALRGGDPTVWDSSSRAKAHEIDILSRDQRSVLRGSVSTTFYTKRAAGDATPFGEPDKPIFITSYTANIDHAAKVGLFVGNARGWQDDSYVHAERFQIDQNGGKFHAEGTVRSTAYEVKQKVNGKETDAPVFATAQAMDYDRDTRVIRYRGDVDIRQGTDRITGQSADISLDDKRRLSKMTAGTSVVLTQPGRKATGDWMQYTADNEVAILRGEPATVADTQSGSSRGTEITVYMREKRVSGTGKTRKGTGGRMRTVYEVKPGQ